MARAEAGAAAPDYHHPYLRVIISLMQGSLETHYTTGR